MADRKKYGFNKAASIISGASAGRELSSPPAGQSIQHESVEASAAPAQSKLQKQLKKIEVPAAAQRAFNLKFIPREKIIFHKKNNYLMEEIEKFSEKILEFGLIHNLEALYDEEKDVYILESGERRTRAIDLLIEKYSNYDGNQEDYDYQNYLKHIKQFEIEGYPVNVKFFDFEKYEMEYESKEAALLTEIDSEIRLEAANVDVRSYDASMIRKKVERLSYLYTERNKMLKKGEKINVNKTLAEDLHMTDRNVKNYKALSKLIPELQELFDRKNISLSDGTNYASLTESEQYQILQLIQEGSDKKEISALSDRLKLMQTQISESKKEVEALEQEKNAAIRKAEKEKANAAEIENRLRTELETIGKKRDAQDQRTIEALQKQLRDVNQSVNEYENIRKKAEQKQKEKVFALEKKLAEKEKPAAINTAVVKAALCLENCINSLETVTVQLKAASEQYQKIYEKSSEEKSPEEYLEDIRTTIEKLKQEF